MLHIHNNHLHSLPTEMTEMTSLKIIVLAFNYFTTIPEILLQSQNSKSNLDSIIMAGNRVEKLPHEVLCRMQHIKKIDLRMNSLSLLPSETAKFHFLELVTHLDVRDNQIKDLDVRSLRSLEYLNCERNAMQSLQVNGSSLKNLYAADNGKSSSMRKIVVFLGQKILLLGSRTSFNKIRWEGRFFFYLIKNIQEIHLKFKTHNFLQKEMKNLPQCAMAA